MPFPKGAAVLNTYSPKRAEHTHLMKNGASSLGYLLAAALTLITTGSALAAPRAACGVLPLAEVRGITGTAVQIFQPGSSLPTTRAGSTFSTCTYVVMDAAGHPARGRGAKFTLTWAPSTKLDQTDQFYQKRHIEAVGVKGDVLALAWVGDASNGNAGDWAASQKLLALVLQKL